jgi:hypothetical protein
MRNSNWTEAEQMKVVWNIIDTEVMLKTEPRTQQRKVIIEGIATKLLQDPDFSERLKADDPLDTIKQHIVIWLGYLENRRERPPLVRK